ncbi:hypothetical protein Ancab_015548 [Ancistrocladus abbreviatus]
MESIGDASLTFGLRMRLIVALIRAELSALAMLQMPLGEMLKKTIGSERNNHWITREHSCQKSYHFGNDIASLLSCALLGRFPIDVEEGSDSDTYLLPGQGSAIDAFCDRKLSEDLMFLVLQKGFLSLSEQSQT